MPSLGMNTMGTADLVIAVAYFTIPTEIAMYLLRRRCVAWGGREGGREGRVWLDLGMPGVVPCCYLSTLGLLPIPPFPPFLQLPPGT